MFKIKSILGIILFDSSWIAGVDYKIDKIDSRNNDNNGDHYGENYELDEIDLDTLAEILQEKPDYF